MGFALYCCIAASQGDARGIRTRTPFSPRSCTSALRRWTLVWCLPVALVVAQAGEAGAQETSAPQAEDAPPDSSEPSLGETPTEASAALGSAEGDSTIGSFLAERVELHAFGNYAAGWTSTNEYLGASPAFEFGNVNLGLRQIARPLEEITLWAGVYFEASSEGLELKLDQAFASWKPTDWLEVQLGRAFYPLGLYTPVYDVGTVRPFQQLPQSVYGSIGLLAESMDGASLLFSTGDTWRLSARLFGGATSLEAVDQELFRGELPDPTLMGEEPRERLSALGGVAVEVLPPLPGLRITAGGIVARAELPGVHLTGQAGVEYVGEKLELRAEYALSHHGGSSRAHGAYLEGGYRIIEPLQVAVRADVLSWEVLHPSPAFLLPDALLSHFGVGATLNYWLTRDLVTRLAYHYVRNNRIAYEEERLFDVLMGLETFDRIRTLSSSGSRSHIESGWTSPGDSRSLRGVACPRPSAKATRPCSIT